MSRIVVVLLLILSSACSPSGLCGSSVVGLAASGTAKVELGAQSFTGNVVTYMPLVHSDAVDGQQHFSLDITADSGDGSDTGPYLDAFADLDFVRDAFLAKKTLFDLDGTELTVGSVTTADGSASAADLPAIDPVQSTQGYAFTVTSYAAPVLSASRDADNWTSQAFLVLGYTMDDAITSLHIAGTLSFTLAKSTGYEECDPCNGQGGFIGCE